MKYLNAEAFDRSVVAGLVVFGVTISITALAGGIDNVAQKEANRLDITVRDAGSAHGRDPRAGLPGGDLKRDLYLSLGICDGLYYRGPDDCHPVFAGRYHELEWEENKLGSNGCHAKFSARDARKWGGEKLTWRVKLGGESFKEPPNDRFFWALGYYCDHNYYLDEAFIRWNKELQLISPGTTWKKYLKAAVFEEAIFETEAGNALAPAQRRIRERLLAKYGGTGSSGRLPVLKLSASEMMECLTGSCSGAFPVKLFYEAMEGDPLRGTRIGKGVIFSPVSLELRPRKVKADPALAYDERFPPARGEKRKKMAAPGETLRLNSWPWNYPRDVWEEGLYLLHGWLNVTDVKDENNKVFLVYTGRTRADGAQVYERVKGFSDLGNGVLTNNKGKATAWSMAIQIHHRNYHADIRNPAVSLRGYDHYAGIKRGRALEFFKEMTFESGRNFVRELAQLDKQDLADALASGGYSFPEFVYALEMLTNRRNDLVKEFLGRDAGLLEVRERGDLSVSEEETGCHITRAGFPVFLKAGKEAYPKPCRLEKGKLAYFLVPAFLP